MAIKRRDTGEIITFGEKGTGSSKSGSGWDARDQTFYGKNLTIRRAAQKVEVVNPAKEKEEKEKRLAELRKQYVVGDKSEENKEILRQIREVADIKPNWVQRTLLTGEAAAKNYAGTLQNTGGFGLETLGKLNDAAFETEYADEIRAAKNSHDYWTKVLAETQDEEERQRAQMALERANSTLQNIADLKELQSRAVDSAAGRVYEKADKKTEEAEQLLQKAKYGASDVGQFLVDVGYGGSQLAADVGIGIATGGGAMLPMAARVFGGSTQEARRAGASYEQQLGYGAASTALSVGTEKIFSLATPLSKAFGGGFADDTVKALAGKLNGSAAGRLVLNALSEGSEEMIEAIVEPQLKKIYDSNAGYDADTISDVLYSGLLGAVLGGGMGAVGEVMDAQSAKANYGESARELAEESLALDPKNRTAKRTIERLDKNKSVSGAMLNNMVRQNEATMLKRGITEETMAEEERKARGEYTEEESVQRLIDALTSESATEEEMDAAAAKWEGYKVDEAVAKERRKVAAQTMAKAYSAPVSDFSEEEARYIVEEGAKEFGNAASSVVNSYVRGQDPQLYMAQAKLAFNYGKTMSEEKGLPYALKSSSLKSLDETQIRSLFNAGRMQAKSIPVSAVKGTGKAVMTDGLDYTLLSPKQKKQVDALSAFAKATGYTIEFFESKTDAEGNYTAEQGSFNTKTGVIRIDINAGKNNVNDLANYAMVRVASHEITHSFKKNAPQQYIALRDYVTGVLADKGEFDDLVDTKMRELGIDHETAVDEVVADGCEMLLRDTRFAEKLAKENRTLFEKIRDAIRKFVKKLRDAFEGVEIAHEEAALLKDAENLQKLWDEALAKSVENVAAAELAEAGIVVNEETESGSLYSVRDVLSDAERKKVSKMLVKQFGVTEAEAMNWLKAETSMASLILNPKYSAYLDYEGDPDEVAIKLNADYPQGTVDFSNICKKRREFTMVMNRILRNFPDHVFAATDLAKIRTIMGEEGMTLPCGICYVEDRRQLDSIVAQDFIDSLKLYREGSKNRPDGKPFNPNQLKGLQLTDGDTYTPTVYELVTLEGRNSLKAKNPNMEQAWVKFNNARGMQAVRLLTNEAEYKRQILKYNAKTVKSKNDHGGLRIYSFSDAEMFHLIDIIQVITDSAAVGLKIQGYTKVNEYARAVKDTGEKLNRSLIPAGKLGYHMEDGKVVLDYDPVEGIDINHKDFFDSKDNPNVGNIVIGINDTQIRAAMVSDFIDYIIPFHTGQSEEVLGEKGLTGWENYKNYQLEKDLSTGKNSKRQVNIYTDVIQAAEAEGKPIQNKRDFVEKFLAVCKELGLKPRFAQFLNTDANGNYVYTEGYHKFLVDFKMFAQTEVGEYLPQMPVKPIFDDAYITDIMTEYVAEQQAKDAEIAKQMPRVIERITDEIIKPEGVAEAGDVVYSKRGYQRRFFPGNVFPSGREHSAAIRWAESENASVGDRKLMLYNGNYYLIEVFSDMDFGYLVMKKYTKGNYREELAEYGEIDIQKPVQERFDYRVARYREKAEHARGGYRADPAQSGYRGEDRSVYGMDADEDGWRDDSGKTERDREDGGGDRRRTGVNYSFRTGYILTDSEGRQLSAEQQEYFRDSKVRGKDGSLMVMYHGTANGGGFTVFDGDKLGNETRTTQLGQGFYFTNVKKEAEAYTNNVDIYGRVSRGTNPYLHKVYLNITNPFDVKTDTLDVNAAKAVYTDGTYAYFFDEWIPFYMNKKTLNGRTFTKTEVQSMSKEDRVSVYVDYLHQFGVKEVLSNMVRAFPYGKQGALLASMQNRLGYDGLVEEFKPGQFQYVAFSSEQVKATDNLTPTANIDIRYSFRTGYIPTDRSILTSYVPKDSDSDTVKKHIAEYQKNAKELKAMQLKRGQMVHDLEALADNNDPKSRAEKKRLREEIVKTDSLIQGLLDQLSRKERWYGVKEVLQKEKTEIMRKAKAEKNEQLKKYREKRWDTETRRKMRERISYRVKTLDKMLREPTDDKHIPEELRKAVFDFCEVFQDEVGVFSQKQLDRLNVAYAFLAEEHEGINASYLYDEDIKEMISQLGLLMDGKRLSELSVEALKFVHNIADHMYFIVRDENEVFLNGRKVKMQTIATKAIEEAKESEKKGGLTIGRDGEAFAKFLTSGNLKPVYLFERTGDQLRDLFNGLLAGQSEYGRREQKAKAFVEQVKKDTNYSEWSSSEETLKMTNGAGQQIELTVQQSMSLLATYERELRQGLFHVTKGGFVYENGVTGDVTVKGVKVPVVKRKVEAEAHPMTADDMDKVRQWLGSIDSGTLDYMERMVEYLSTTMAAYGNETSMQLHGYKKFSEGYYFPIRSSDDYLNKDPGKGGFDENRWKNKGFTKALTKSANNPFVLIDFDKVWSNHVSQMLMYSTMAVPQESFVRVLNFKTPVDPTGLSNSESMRSVIKQYYGSKVADYIDTLLRDVNGGVTTDSRATVLNRLVSTFKKNATFASASVVVQQISSVARATALIAPKHFAGGNPVDGFKEALEHSGVAVIKQMGGFDTTTGRGGAEWLMEETPNGWKNKAKALTQFGEKDTGYRDRVFSILPAKMDELGFGMIWNAVKNEVSDSGEYEDGTEAFYVAVTKRFEEVIEKTQVYDSVLSRSENMRGKDGLLKAATSFMAEPTVTANMMMDAAWKLAHNKDKESGKYLGRVIASLLLAMIANNLLKAAATAPRDKDEDQTILEKYVEDVFGGIKSDINPFGYVPFLRDIKSIWEGYTVEASYAAPVADAIDAFKDVRDDRSFNSWVNLVVASSGFFGLPLKNIKRDLVDSFINLFGKTANLSEGSTRGLRNAILEGWNGELPGVDDAMEKAYRADKRGNEAQRKKALEEVKKLYEDKVKQYRLEGKDEPVKKAKSSLKSSITAELKPLYQAATTQAEKNRIKSLALRVYVGGEQLYNGYDFERYWGEE